MTPDKDNEQPEEEVAGVSRLAVHHKPELTEGGLEDLPAAEALGDSRVTP